MRKPCSCIVHERADDVGAEGRYGEAGHKQHGDNSYDPGSLRFGGRQSASLASRFVGPRLRGLS